MLKFAPSGKFSSFPFIATSVPTLFFLVNVEGDIHLQSLSIKSFYFDFSREYKLNVHFLLLPLSFFVRLLKKEVEDVFREIRE